MFILTRFVERHAAKMEEPHDSHWQTPDTLVALARRIDRMMNWSQLWSSHGCCYWTSRRPTSKSRPDSRSLNQFLDRTVMNTFKSCVANEAIKNYARLIIST